MTPVLLPYSQSYCSPHVLPETRPSDTSGPPLSGDPDGWTLDALSLTQCPRVSWSSDVLQDAFGSPTQWTVPVSQTRVPGVVTGLWGDTPDRDGLPGEVQYGGWTTGLEE